MPSPPASSALNPIPPVGGECDVYRVCIHRLYGIECYWDAIDIHAWLKDPIDEVARSHHVVGSVCGEIAIAKDHAF